MERAVVEAPLAGSGAGLSKHREGDNGPPTV